MVWWVHSGQPVRSVRWLPLSPRKEPPRVNPVVYYSLSQAHLVVHIAAQRRGEGREVGGGALQLGRAVQQQARSQRAVGALR